VRFSPLFSLPPQRITLPSPLFFLNELNADRFTSSPPQWVFQFIIARETPAMVEGMGHAGWGMFLMFTIFNLLSAVFTYFFIPETKGRTLEDMDILFGGSFPFPFPSLRRKLTFPPFLSSPPRRRRTQGRRFRGTSRGHDRRQDGAEGSARRLSALLAGKREKRFSRPFIFLVDLSLSFSYTCSPFVVLELRRLVN
jgi:hypothetical protein